MWQDNLDPTIREHFDSLLNKVVKEKKAYSSAKHPSRAQLWAAVAVLTKELSDLRLQVKRLESQVKKKGNPKLKKSLNRF
jgi:hypothetical protein